MSTFFLDWNNDLILTPNGSIQMAEGWDEIRQRIIRRAITNSATTLPDGSETAADYIFHTGYGEGLGALVDQNPVAQFWSSLQQAIVAAAQQDVMVDPGSVPVINFARPRPDTYIVYIQVKLLTGQPGTISFVLSGARP